MNTVIFEKETIARFYGDSATDVIEIFDEYLSSQEEMLQSLCTAFLSGNRALSNCLHFHASIFTYVGFSQLTRDCIAFENECKTNLSKTEMEAKFNVLISKIRQSSLLIQQEINEMSNICYS